MFRWGNMSLGQEDPEYQVESGSPFETREHGVTGIGSYTAMDQSDYSYCASRDARYRAGRQKDS